jgi:hypothetical protein
LTHAVSLTPHSIRLAASQNVKMQIPDSRLDCDTSSVEELMQGLPAIPKNRWSM